MSLRFNLNFAGLRSRVDALSREAPGLFEEAARRAMEQVREDLEATARARHRRNSPAGHATRFVTRTRRNGNAVRVFVENTAGYHRWVEEGRAPGVPVLSSYVDNATNRRMGRVGASYVAGYVSPNTGRSNMPPPGIFDDYGPDFARRRKIARDGIPAKWIVRDVRSRFDAADLYGEVARQIRLAWRRERYRRARL